MRSVGWRPGGLLTCVLLGAGAAAGLAATAPARASEWTGRLVIARPASDPALEAVAEGFGSWLRHRVATAGLSVAPRAAGGLPDRDALLSRARDEGASFVVFPDLRQGAGMVTLRLVVHDGTRGRIVAAANATEPLHGIGAAASATATRLLEAVGVEPGAVPATPPPLLDELAASGRALRLRDAGELAHAWRQVERKLSPTAARMRDELVAEARRAGAPLAERARVLAAAGDSAAGWALVEPLLRGRAAADPRLLLAAGEIQLARNNPREARRLLEQAVATAPDDPEIQRALARVLTLQSDRDGARRALARAAELDPADPRLLEQLAQLSPADPEERGRLLLRAGSSAARRLEAHRAEALLERAIAAAPSTSAEVWRERAELRARLGRHAGSLEAWRGARDAGAPEAVVLRGTGTAQRALGDAQAARASYTQALSKDPRDTEVLRALGELHVEAGRAEDAVPLLERAVRIDPASAAARRALAHGLSESGRREEALALLSEPGGAGNDSPESLTTLAAIHIEAGHLEEAGELLDRAARRAPYAAFVHSERARLAAARGDAGAAQSARELASILAGTSERTPAEGAQLARAAAEEGEAAGPDFEALAGSFAGGRRRQTVAFLGLYDAPTWRGRLATWLHPRRPDRAALVGSLERSLAEFFDVVTVDVATLTPALRAPAERIRDFEAKHSLDAETIAALNRGLGSDALFVARLERMPEEEEGARGPGCGAPGRFEVEARMLEGQIGELVSILSNGACIPDGFSAFGTWNARALVLHAILLAALLYPIVRGWGVVVVKILLPPRTKGFFSIRISTNPDDLPAEPRRKDSGRLKRSLRSLSRFERHMAGAETVFRWIPAKRRTYHVTVKGPLLDATGEEIIGHFLETKPVRVLRRRDTTLEYDFRPRECAVEVLIQWEGQPIRGARLALRGERALRYAREGTAILPLGEGEHCLLAGHKDRVAEYRIRIESLGRALQVVIDLANEATLVFRGCPEAVEAYLQSDYGTAADALEQTGQVRAAHLVRAEHLRRIGQADRAAEALEAAGCLDEAAELRAESADLEGSAALFERAGDFARAADAYRAAGDLASAARCYESAYDYDNALECYRESGDAAKEADVLEKTGAYLEAAGLSARLGDTERAIRNLQFVGHNDHIYPEACKLFSEVLAAREEWDVAAEKLGEAIDAAGGEHAPPEMLERHAQLLEKAGQTERAVTAYQTLRRRDPQRENVAERIASLERVIQSTQAAAPAEAPAPTAVGGDGRYEILGELGRGAMGLVYRARDRHLGRVVALKRLPENLRDHPAAVALFKREAQAAAALNHRNIVTLYDAGEEDGNYFITMELLEGLPLNTILKKRGVLGPRDTARLGLQIAAGLQYAHEKRIVHRDIKTGNLFFTRDKTVKIMDFGLAKTLEEVQKGSTMIGGTPYFMAPEQAAGEELDHRADLYALGVTLFQLCTGAVPFRDGDLAYHHRHTPAPDPRTHAPALPPGLAELILALLEKRPEDRPESAGDVGRALQTVLAEGAA